MVPLEAARGLIVFRWHINLDVEIRSFGRGLPMKFQLQLNKIDYPNASP